MNIGFAVADFLTQVVLVIVGIVLVFDPELLVRQVDFGTTPTVGDFLIAIPVGDGRLHGHRDDLEHGRGGARLRQDDPARDRPGGRRRGRDLHVPARPWRCRRCRSMNGQTILALPKEQGGYADDPVLGVVEEHGPGLAAARRPRSTSASWPRRSCSSRRTPGSSACRGSATRWASTASCRSCCALLHPRFRTPYIAIIVFGADRLHRDPPGPGRLPRRDLRVRRDALVHDGARGGDRRCGSSNPDAERPWQGPAATSRSAAASCRCSRSSAALGTGIALIVATVLDMRVLDRPGVGWLALGIALYVWSTGAARGCR